MEENVELVGYFLLANDEIVMISQSSVDDTLWRTSFILIHVTMKEQCVARPACLGSFWTIERNKEWTV